MPDPEKTAPVEPIQPLSAVVVSQGTGNGGRMLSQLLTTPGLQPNLIVTVVTPLAALLIRVANVFLQTLVGLVTAGLTPLGSTLLPASDFSHLVLTCASLSVAAAGVCFLQNLVSLFSKLEQQFPLLRA